MPTGDNSEQTNLAVIVSRLNEVSRKVDDLLAKDSLRLQRLNELAGEKASRVELSSVSEKLEAKLDLLEATQARDATRISVVTDRLSWVTLLISGLSLVLAGIAAYIGHLP